LVALRVLVRSELRKCNTTILVFETYKLPGK
jgi:hypothetical protein